MIDQPLGDSYGTLNVWHNDDGSSKEHHFTVRKQVVQWTQTQGIKPAARKSGIARNAVKTRLRCFNEEVIRKYQTKMI